MPYGHASMLLLGEGSEATEPYNKYEKIRPHSIPSLQFYQKVRPLSFRPEKFDLFTATRPLKVRTRPTSLEKRILRFLECSCESYILPMAEKCVFLREMARSVCFESFDIISFFVAFVFSDLLLLLSFFCCVSAWLLFLFIFPHLLGRSFLLYNFDIAPFIEISPCQWLTLHPPRAIVCRPRQTRVSLHPEGIGDSSVESGLMK